MSNGQDIRLPASLLGRSFYYLSSFTGWYAR